MTMTHDQPETVSSEDEKLVDQLRQQLERIKREYQLEIAERKGAEELLARQAAVLQEQADLLDLTYDAIIVRSLGGEIRFWNRGAEERYGWRVEEALGQNCHTLLDTYFGRPREQVQDELLATGRWEGELTQARRDGTRLTVFSRWALQRNDDGQPMAVLEISSDITELKQAERTLARQGERLQMLHAIDQAILAAQSPADIAQAVARRMRQMLPCRHAGVALFDYDEEFGRWLAVDTAGLSSVAAGQVTPLADFGSLSRWAAGQALYTPNLGTVHNLPAHAQMLLADGIRSYLSLPLLAGGRLIGVLVLGQDTPNAFEAEGVEFARQAADSLAVAIQNANLNEQVRSSRQQLQNLSRRLAELQEDERQHIASELYDDAGQNLAALLLRLGMLEQAVAGSADAGAQIRAMKILADSVLADLHKMAVHLRPASLDKLGLVPALRQYVEQINEEGGPASKLEVVGVPARRLPLHVETTLYRAVVEAITNVVHHAHANNMGIVLAYRDNRVVAIVEDDGMGFDVRSAMERGRLGLFGMRQRIEDLGGTLTVESSPGQGTAVYVEVPLGG